METLIFVSFWNCFFVSVVLLLGQGSYFLSYHCHTFWIFTGWKRNWNLISLALWKWHGMFCCHGDFLFPGTNLLAISKATPTGRNSGIGQWRSLSSGVICCPLLSCDDKWKNLHLLWQAVKRYMYRSLLRSLFRIHCSYIKKIKFLCIQKNECTYWINLKWITCTQLDSWFLILRKLRIKNKLSRIESRKTENERITHDWFLDNFT